MGADARRVLLLTVLLWAGGSLAQPILDRKVDVRAKNVRLADALRLIAEDAHFKLSYNSNIVNGDSIVDVATGPTTVKRAIEQLLGKERTLRESGDHLIILGERQGKQKFTVSGSIVDAVTGHAIARASVYEVREKATALSDASGTFNIEVSGRQERTALRISRIAFQDTVIFVDRSGKAGRIRLQAKDALPLLETRAPGLEQLELSRVLVRSSQIEQAANLGYAEERAWQVSLVPTISSNGKASGAMVNRRSLNVIGGYARGLNGWEVAGAFNMERRDVDGVQIAGLTNLVGGSTHGVQIAGAVNHTMRTLRGLQLAGLGNVVWDTLSGVQVSGGFNVVKGGMLGVQVSGLANVTTQSCRGAQISGGANVTLKEVDRWQAGGYLNYGRSVSGLQLSGGINVVLDSVGGGQVAGLLNYGRDVTGGQVSGMLNVALRSVRGGQVGFLNVAKRCEGGQVGFMNVADTITGASVGFFSFAWRGYHRVDVHYDEVFPVTVMFRTGTHRFYNAFSFSPQLEPNGRWGFGYGLGTEIGWPGKHVLNIEWDSQHVNERDKWISAVNILSTLNLTYGYCVTKWLVLSAGPNLNVLSSDWRKKSSGEFLTDAAPRVDWQEKDNKVLYQGWLGFRAGAGVRF